MNYTPEELEQAENAYAESNGECDTAAMKAVLDAVLPGYTQRISAEIRAETLAEVSNGVRIFDPMLADRIKEIIATEGAAALAAPVEPRREHLGGCNTESDYPCSCGAAPAPPVEQP